METSDKIKKLLAAQRAKQLLAKHRAAVKKQQRLEAEAAAQFEQQASLRAARAYLAWVEETPTSSRRPLDAPCPVEITDDGRLSMLPVNRDPVKKDRTGEVTTIVRDFDSGNRPTRRMPEAGFVQIDPDDFWYASLADRKIILQRLCNAPGARERMEASRLRGTVLRATINAEIAFQAAQCRKLGKQFDLGTRRPAKPKGVVKQIAKRDQKQANTLGQGYGTASFKRPKWARTVGSAYSRDLSKKEKSYFEHNSSSNI